MVNRGLYIAVTLVCLALSGCPGDDNSGPNGEGEPDGGPGMDADATAPMDGSGGGDADRDVAPDASDDTGGTADGDAGMSGDIGDDAGSPDTGITCPTGLTPCGTVCVDQKTNDSHCGSCNSPCNAGQVCAGGSCTAGTQNLVLSELNNHGQRFIELYNGDTSPVNLKDWRIQWQTEANASGTTVLPDYELAPDTFVAVYSREVVYRGEDGLGLDSQLPAYDAIGVRLLDPQGSGADFVRTGNSSVPHGPGDSWTNMTAPPTPDARIDQSLVRNVYEPDTDSGSDWSLTTPQSPGSYCAGPGRCGTDCVDQSTDRQHCGACGVTCGAGQICQAGACVSAKNHLWLTEYRRFPSPGVEIQNPTGNPIDLENYRLEIGPQAYTFPARTLQPGAYLFVAAGHGPNGERLLFSGISETEFEVSVSLSLLDNTGSELDFVPFGAASTSVPNWFGDAVQGVASANVSARRDTKVLDSNSNTDWYLDTPSTPGVNCQTGMRACGGICVDQQVHPNHCGACGNVCAAHESCVSGSCQSTGTVVLSELRNWASETFEVYNGTGSTVDIGGYQLKWTADNSSGSYTVPSGTALDPGEFIVFLEGGGSGNDLRKYMNTDIRWETGIALTLENASGSAVDFVRTGGISTGPPAGTSWSGSNADNPPDDSADSLVRDVYGPDTNSAADWSVENGYTEGGYCEDDATVCGSGCVSLQDRSNCGACGRRCPDGNICVEGRCDLPEGALRLHAVGGSGRLEIYHNGEWGTVCDDSFSNADAAVACQQLGYSGGTTDTSVPAGSGEIWLDDVDCQGDELRLASCQFPGWGIDNCAHIEDVGLNCN